MLKSASLFSQLLSELFTAVNFEAPPNNGHRFRPAISLFRMIPGIYILSPNEVAFCGLVGGPLCSSPETAYNSEEKFLDVKYTVYAKRNLFMT